MADGAASPPNAFLSWSLPRSKAVATALHAWLPRVVQACDPWMSAEDLHAGKRWRREVSQHLVALKIGILCVTPENLDRRWLNYEAGALSRSLDDDRRVIPYCFGLDVANLGDPLSDFNAAAADRDGTLMLVTSINDVMPRPIKEATLRAVFERLWPDLERELQAIPAETQVPKAPKRSDRELLEEVVARVRDLEAEVSRQHFFSRTVAGSGKVAPDPLRPYRRLSRAPSAPPSDAALKNLQERIAKLEPLMETFTKVLLSKVEKS